MPAQLDRPRIEEHLGGQRWFAGKGRAWTVTSVRTVAQLREQSADASGVRIDLVQVTYDDGESETYQLPLATYGAPAEHLAHALVGEEDDGAGGTRFVYDALQDKESTTLWVEGIDADRTGAGFAFHREPTAGDLPPGGPSIVVGAEQSNTSLIFGDTLILKVFRKVSPGLNPDIEMHSALAAAGSTHIAAPLGWLEGDWQDGPEPGTASLAMAQVFLKGATEGWELALTSVRDLYAEADLHADEVGGDFAGEARRLGQATAEVHAALAAVLPTGRLEGKELVALAEGMRVRLDRAAAEVPDLATYVDKLRTAFDDLAAMDEPLPVQRVHGDFHLGQVMRTLQGWKLLDFEGEPLKPLEERRLPDSPWRDVAGMLRSFDYAAQSVVKDLHFSAEAGPQITYRANEWLQRNRTAFLEGYVERRVERGEPALTLAERTIIDAYEADKAVYEVVYEARNRPTWL
jgi:maltokinase